MRWLINRILASRSELDEAAFALPVLLLVSLGLINLALLGFAAINAGNAANYGARMGSVAQYAPASVAYSAAQQKVAAARVGSYSVAVDADDQPGGMVLVTVSYRVPNYFGALAQMFGINSPAEFQGRAIAIFRKEGW